MNIEKVDIPNCFVCEIINRFVGGCYLQCKFCDLPIKDQIDELNEIQKDLPELIKGYSRYRWYLVKLNIRDNFERRKLLEQEELKSNKCPKCGNPVLKRNTYQVKDGTFECGDC